MVQRQTASRSPCMRTRLAVSQLAGRVSMELASYPFVADSPELIGRQLRRRFVAIIHAPDVPITKIVEQFLVLLVTHIARPYDAGVIAVEPQQSQAAHTLHEDEIKDAGRGRHIIRECPKFD